MPVQAGVGAEIVPLWSHGQVDQARIARVDGAAKMAEGFVEITGLGVQNRERNCRTIRRHLRERVGDDGRAAAAFVELAEMIERIGWDAEFGGVPG